MYKIKIKFMTIVYISVYVCTCTELRAERFETARTRNRTASAPTSFPRFSRMVLNIYGLGLEVEWLVHQLLFLVSPV